jgi:DNA-binding NtrC family response regulator
MKSDSFKILVVDDDDSIRTRCIQLLQRKSYAVKGASDGSQALFSIAKEWFPLVLADIRMPGIDGIDLLKKIKETSPDTEVVMLTGYGTVDNAVEAMKLGAYDYVTKPFDMDRLLKIVEHVETQFSLKTEINSLRNDLDTFSYEEFIAVSDKARQILALAQKVAPIDCSVLIQGESGTGKGILAHALHLASSRREKPFIVVDCAALTETLLESELFGYRKGAFTGAYADKDGYFKIADKGTIFLDEISELSIPLQGKLLRMTQDHEVVPVGSTKSSKVNTRIISATNRNLEDLVKERRFREDLFFRINVVRIEIPPLRERRDEILPLMHFFFNRFKKRFDKRHLSIDDRVLAYFLQYQWPGNVRELENTVQQMVITADRDKITVADLPDKVKCLDLAQTMEDPTDSSGLVFAEARKQSLDRFTRAYLVDALRCQNGNVSKTAKQIKVQRPSLQRMIKRYKISK